MTRDIDAGRQVLKLLRNGPLRFRPILDDRRRGYQYQFAGTIALWDWNSVLEGWEWFQQETNNGFWLRKKAEDSPEPL